MCGLLSSASVGLRRDEPALSFRGAGEGNYVREWRPTINHTPNPKHQGQKSSNNHAFKPIPNRSSPLAKNPAHDDVERFTMLVSAGCDGSVNPRIDRKSVVWGKRGDLR